MAQAISEVRPTLSLAERDRRYNAIRDRLRERGVDCVIVTGSNLFYISNGLPGERTGLLPADNLPATVCLNSRHLADLSAQVVIDAQDWIQDVRAGNDARPLLERISELKLQSGTIGVIPGSISHSLYAQLEAGLPNGRLVDVSDVLADVRTTKSDEEIAMIDQANRVFDAAVYRLHEVARAGMLGVEVVQEGTKAMWEAGGDLNSTFGFNFGPVPKQNPVLCELCLTRRIQPGDIGTMTAHAHYGGYGGHSDHEISFGAPQPLHQEMYQAVLHVREQVLSAVKPGATQRGLVEVYQRACAESGFRSSPHSQIHQYGIDVPEFPGPAFNASDESGRGGRADFVLAPGMIYSISPTLVAANGDDTMLGGTCLVVTEDGFRELGDRKVELLIAES
jgi:Xaa-Pro aminopeptidase